MSVVEDLRHYGPDAPPRSLSRDEAWAYCDRFTRSHQENFSVLTWLTPRTLRPALQAVYAYCRWSDDLGDEIGDPERSRRLLAWWRGQLSASWADPDRANHPVLIALAETAQQFPLMADPFHDLISAFEQDQTVTRYATYQELVAYCQRSANPVGRIILQLAGRVTTENLVLSDAICTGLQLANFWQDVARDAAIGRIYLPQEDLEAFRVRESEIVEGRFTEEFASLLRFEVDRPRQLLEAGAALPGRMPGRLALDVELFRLGGLAVLRRIEDRRYDVLSERPVVGGRTKAGLIVRAVSASLSGSLRRRATPNSPVTETEELAGAT